ncbi:MAG: sodium:solute symporter family protein [Deltaproteobacteria bacterium]|nr:sodium:solute symporter family protein [Deltaproteobacteria bacterium]MBK8717719.1 sodium:solute symporter family protein [Deltaproteobacteria bacterium]MBP7288768.1 sodium:solute symporter family protein [Nannocystaceae bacterium]
MSALLLPVLLYFGVVLVVGAVAARATSANAEDFFLGSRSARTLVLFMALFGTNVTPFVLLGIPGLAYHEGVGVFGYNAAIVALGIPLSFWLIARPAWHEARRQGAISPAELYARKLGSPALGVVLFGAFTIYTLPYMVTSVIGVALATEVFSGGAIDGRLAALALLVVTAIYTAVGGMRATMWTNVVQGVVFMGFVLAAFVAIAAGLGGPAAATAAVLERAPSLLVLGDRPRFAAGAWGSWALAISLTVIAFPHMLVRVFAARDPAALRNTVRLYPAALVLLWLPVVLIGVWGAVAVPGLEGRASDRVLPMMVVQHLPPWMHGVGLAAILAAVMSTLDAQFLTLSSMFGRDVLRRIRRDLHERTEVRAGQVFSLLLAAITWALVVWSPASIFGLATFSFSGYVMLVPTLWAALVWRRFTATAAMASIVAGNAVLLLTMRAGTPLGLLPVAWGLAAASVVALVLPWAWPRRQQPSSALVR